MLNEIRVYTLQEAEVILKRRRKKKLKRWVTRHISLWKQKLYGITLIALGIACWFLELKAISIICWLAGVTIIITTKEVMYV